MIQLEGIKRLSGLIGAAVDTIEVTGVSIDSRTIERGELFVAIRGKRFDGHDFVERAVEKGAKAVLIQQDRDKERTWNLPEGVRTIVVEDTVTSLGELASRHRRRFDIPLIAITGSNGKTTTKEMTADVLATSSTVHRSQGNLNNHLGVPLSLFELREGQQYAVLEMGVNHFGELDYLCNLAEPTAGLITNISAVHTEYFDSQEGVAKAKGELFNALPKDGTAFVNIDDHLIPPLAKKLSQTVTYGFTGKADVRGELIDDDRGKIGGLRINGEVSIRLQVGGRGYASNALAAAAVGLHFGVSLAEVKSALEAFSGSPHRMQELTIAGRFFIDDTYNANPASVHEALEVLARRNSVGKKVVVLGDMLELGEDGERAHRAVGEEVQAFGIQTLMTFGALASAAGKNVPKSVNFGHFQTKNDLARALLSLTERGDLVLVKGSRAMRMEDVLEAFRAEAAGMEGPAGR